MLLGKLFDIQNSMDIVSRQFLIVCFLASQALTSYAQTCSKYIFSSDQMFSSCRDLPVLQAHLHWNYIPSTNTIHIAYRAAQTSEGWIAWGINPTGSGMVGTQAIVSFRRSNGSMTAYPTSIMSYNPSLQPSSLSFQVSNISAEYASGEMTIFAVVGPLATKTSLNHVWQAGNSVSDNIPQGHQTSGPNVQSMETIHFKSG
ncbi:hypothetical protein L484_020036 [Morus notabilis]|uniref:DOMON domain-containing protein n=1 Tax=Morus notabilis TaxID=981085 RepID=W9SC02_9ROSA|nr:cytochrome b561 and DOMON domain-containing protein At5g47530 [Morus notabilis]EXC34919.1 hypothetical protein L484_020036 [Morus notabilis]